MQTVSDRERIDLLRCGSVMSSFAGAFGSALRETRLTAMLGYLIALEPERFCNIFAFRGRPLSVSLETHHESDRSDILIDTTAGRGVIEAKCKSKSQAVYNREDPPFAKTQRVGHSL
jgi:hypothetical protein